MLISKVCSVPRFFVAILMVAAVANYTNGQKITSEEVVSKHLASIGSEDARAKLKNIVATGVVQYGVLRQGGAGAGGKIVFASEGTKSLVGMTFSVPTYPGDTFVFDGKNLKIAFAYNNVRSYIGDYLYRYDDVIKEGLFGGTLSTGWPLLAFKDRKSKLEYAGTRKIDGRDVIVLGYSKKGGSDLEIRLFFDGSTYEHIRTEYRRTVSSQIGSAVPSVGGGVASPPSTQGATGARAADASSSQRELRQVLVEEFSNFKKENSLNLPHNYRAYLMLEGAQGTREYEWKAELTAFFINQPLDPSSFDTGPR